MNGEKAADERRGARLRCMEMRSKSGFRNLDDKWRLSFGKIFNQTECPPLTLLSSWF